jgi:hypothetical protein
VVEADRLGVMTTDDMGHSTSIDERTPHQPKANEVNQKEQATNPAAIPPHESGVGGGSHN